jgi:hypothetical protein
VRFPDPAQVATRGAQVALVPLTVLVELKLGADPRGRIAVS